MDFPLETPPVPVGWHWKPAEVETQVHARCESAAMDTPKLRWPDCYEVVAIGADARLPAYCPNCELALGDEDDDDDDPDDDDPDDDEPEHGEAP